VLEYHKAILACIHPGVTVTQIMDEAKAAMEPVLARRTFSKPIYEEAARDLVDRAGGVFSHTVGMAVDDVARYADAPLRPGQVLAVDAQLRVPEQRLYIRYEDLVVVTETGVENLTDFLVSELDEIEATVRQGGIVQDYPLRER